MIIDDFYDYELDLYENHIIVQQHPPDEATTGLGADGVVNKRLLPEVFIV